MSGIFPPHKKVKGKSNPFQSVAEKSPGFGEERDQLGLRSHLDCRRLSLLQYSKVIQNIFFFKIFFSYFQFFSSGLENTKASQNTCLFFLHLIL